MKRVAMSAFGALIVSGTAQAQTTVQWPAPAAYTDNAQTFYLPMGTGLVLRTRTEVNTKQAKPGDRLYLEVAESVTFRGQVVVPVGAPAVAEVVRSERNGHFGKKGKIEIRLISLETPSGPVRLFGGAADNGKGAGLWSIGGIALTGGIGWGLIHGTSGYIRSGTPVNGYLAEPLRFTHQPQQVQVAVVQADPKPLPTRFDPSVFGGNRPGLSQR